jgi:hypothetical protein
MRQKTIMSECPPPLHQRFWPFSSSPPPAAGVAVETMSVAAEPASGSEMATAQTRSPAMAAGSSRSFSCAEPNLRR